MHAGAPEPTAGLLLRGGATHAAILDGGPQDWATVTGRSLKEDM